MSVLDDIIEKTLGHEGGYSNHVNDTGGETMWGITKRVARANGYHGPMRSMPRQEAIEIYRKRYLVGPGFSQFADTHPMIAGELFDTGVNMGPGWACEFLQRALNGLNNQGKLYGDIVEDRDCGPATRRAFYAYMKARGKEAESVLLKALEVQQGARYISLARGRPRNESFLYGWLRTRIGL